MFDVAPAVIVAGIALNEVIAIDGSSSSLLQATKNIPAITMSMIEMSNAFFILSSFE